MVTAAEAAHAESLAHGLEMYEAAEGALPGLGPSRRDPFVRQMVDSMRRNRYVELLLTRDLTRHATDPSDVDRFDPLKAAIIFKDQGKIEEAFWMMFLFTHFGKNRRGGWEYARRVYGGLGTDSPWTWREVSERTEEFRDWLDAHHDQLATPPGGFGNHRKRESLSGRSDKGTGIAVATYVDWTGAPPSQQARFDEAIQLANGDPDLAFDMLNHSLRVVRRFGRLARFDYLNTIGKIGLADVRPGKAYLKDSSGPLKGARELFGPAQARPATDWYEHRVAVLCAHLHVGFDVIEDALCNWQKYPDEFKRFRG